MTLYKANLLDGIAQSLKRHKYHMEGGDIISPQKIIVNNPSIILDIPELEIQTEEKILVAEEYNTNRGSIDILIITSNADIVIIEAKLPKNPESNRTVVAQTIDYTKAFYNENINDLINKLSRNQSINESVLSDFRSDGYWVATLDKNIKSGNFKVIILGDRIHPNVLGMVESIQSAPHMSFTIYLVALNTYDLDSSSVALLPTIVSNTVEVERSVIRIEIDHEKKSHIIESEIPEPEGKGTKPILSPEQFLDGLSKQEFRPIIEKSWNEWRNIGGNIRFATIGFSMGIKIGGKYRTLFYANKNHIPFLSDRLRLSQNISDEMYQEYKNDIKDSQIVYDEYLIGNKAVGVPYSEIQSKDLETMLQAAFNLTKRLLNEDIT